MIDHHVHLEKGDYTLDFVMPFINKAKENGITEIYFVEHTHAFLEFSFLYDEVRAYSKAQEDWYQKKKKKNLMEYFSFINYLRGLNLGIEIKIGLEICYSSMHEEELRIELKKYPFDFLIGSVHFVFGYGIDLQYEEYPFVDKLYKEYFKEERKLIQSRLFTIIGHPDLIRIIPCDYPLTDEYIKLAILARENIIMFEHNSGNWRYHMNHLGLDLDFIKILKANDVKIVLSSDAHEAQYVGYHFQEMMLELK